MDREIIKAWLERYKGIEEKNLILKSEIEDIKRYYANSYKTTSTLKNINVMESKGKSKVENIVLETESKIENLERQILNNLRIKRIIDKTRLEFKSKEVAIFELRYIQSEKWENIIELLEVSRKTVFCVNTRIINKIYNNVIEGEIIKDETI